MSFELVPALTVLRAGAPVNEVWRAVGAAEPIPGIAMVPTVIRVWRQELRVVHQVIERTEEVALGVALAGEPFAAICEAIAATVSDEEAPGIAARVLHTWFADGLVVSAG